jgi:two-component system response regulator FixJ
MLGTAETVYVVDRDAAVRLLVCALAHSIDMPCKEFTSACDFLQHYQLSLPGCLVLDMETPDMTGLALQHELALRDAIIPVIFVAERCEVGHVVKAMRRGAFNFLQKPLANTELLDNIERALELDRRNRLALAQNYTIRQQFFSLTPREREVLDQVCRGESNKMIAANLRVSERSVEFHRARGMEKMGARSVAQLVRMFMNLEDDSTGPSVGPGRRRGRDSSR